MASNESDDRMSLDTNFSDSDSGNSPAKKPRLSGQYVITARKRSLRMAVRPGGGGNGNVRAVRILLECILLLNIFTLADRHLKNRRLENVFTIAIIVKKTLST